MKYLFFYVLFLTVLSCSQEKAISKTQDEGLFKSKNNEVKPFVSGVNNSELQQNQISGTKIKTNKELIIELLDNGIPKSLPSNEFKSWQEFDLFYSKKSEKLSSGAKQYCSELLLRSYNFSNSKYKPQEVRKVVFDNIKFLAQNGYRGYELLYNHLNWMKENGYQEYTEIQTLIVKYAAPSLKKRDQSIPDDPIVTANPVLKKRMDEIVLQMQKDDEYIAKIYAL